MAQRNSLLDQLTPTQRIALAVAVLVILGIIALVRTWKEPSPTGEPGQTLTNRNVRFGMPAEAKTDSASKDAYLIEREQYVLSYNDSKKTPNWVCWNLKKSDIGDTKRAPGFEPDPDLPAGFHHIRQSDYNGSGFDRGHICPSKDRSDTPENNKFTFFTTNIVPQAPKCNRGTWERFESHCRDLTRDGSELYIAAGPDGEGGTGEHGPHNTIGKPSITVPATVWKVVLVLPNGESTPTQTTRAIAVWMPNNQSITDDWKSYVISVADVEKRTGYKFFPLVPDDVANTIKTRVDRGP